MLHKKSFSMKSNKSNCTSSTYSFTEFEKYLFSQDNPQIIVPLRNNRLAESSQNSEPEYFTINKKYIELTYCPDFIKFDNMFFRLKKCLDNSLTIEEKYYIIRNEDLDITVWGDTLQEAKKAFDFCFYSLYENFYDEINTNLSNEAIILKQKLYEIIDFVNKTNETQENG